MYVPIHEISIIKNSIKELKFSVAYSQCKKLSSKLDVEQILSCRETQTAQK